METTPRQRAAIEDDFYGGIKYIIYNILERINPGDTNISAVIEEETSDYDDQREVIKAYFYITDNYIDYDEAIQKLHEDINHLMSI